MKAIAIFMISVLWIANQVKSQENENQSPDVKYGIDKIGNASDGFFVIPADESALRVYEPNSAEETAILNDTVADIETVINSPSIIIEPEFLLQYGNYLGTCAPPMTYVVHGRYLTENLVIYDNFNGSAYFSLTGQNDYVSTLTVVPVNGIVDTTIYVRHCPDFYDNHTYVTNSSSGTGAGLEVETDPIAGNAPVTRIGKVQAEPGTTISVPLKVTGMEYMHYIQYVIEFNPTVLTFQEWEDPIMYWIKSTSVIAINPELSQLIIEIESPSDNYITIVDNENILELKFLYSSGSTAINFGECSFRNFFNLFPNDEPASEYYFDGSVSSSIKSTTVLLNLEGLYNPDLGKMNQAMGETGPHFPGEIADQVTIRLASASASYSTLFEIDSVDVDQNGRCGFKVPAIYEGNYYLAVSHRNSLETWSATPVSFNDSVVQYDFTTSVCQAYGNNLKAIGDGYGIYAGDTNQDGVIDSEDMTPVDNDATAFSSGYITSDISGDGITDTWDMTFLDNNSCNFVEKKFPSSECLPVLMTDSITDITLTSAICHGSILHQGSTQLTARGVCWDTSPEPDITGSHTVEGGGSGFFESSFTGLAPNTLYYIRTYASNNEGTSYGNEMSFNSAIFSPGEGVTDVDNNNYSTVIIGYQEWLAENLNVTHYRNGDPIPNVTDSIEWRNLTTGAFCWYDNDEITYSNTYGALYNWYSVIDPRGLCPSGWHVPSDSDWNELITNYLGSLHIAGFKMKSTSGWNNNANGNNLSGFAGLPGGMRYYHPYYLSFNNLGIATGWWSSTEQDISTAMYRYLAYPVSNHKKSGYSVRCLKD